MRNKKSIIVLAAICISINVFLVQAADNSTSLKIAGDNNFPPYEFIAEDGTYQGFNVDIMRAIAAEMQIELRLIPMQWNAAVKALDTEVVDALQGMTYSKARAKKYDFTKATVINQQSIFILKDTEGIIGPESLNGKIVSFQKGDIVETLLKKYPDIIFLPIANQEAAFKALLENKAVAFAGNRMVGLYLAQKANALDKIKIVGSPLNEERYAIATLRRNQAVYNQLREGLVRIKDNGVYDTIYNKWFGERFTNQAQMSKRIIIALGVALLLALVIFLITLVLTRQLKKMVQRRTEELSAANDKLLMQQEELMASAKALAKSENKFRTIFANAPFGITLSNSLTGKYYDINPKYAEILGRSIEELKKADWMSMTHPEDLQKDLDNVALVTNNINKSKDYQMQKRMLKADGSVVWVNMRITGFELDGQEDPQHICMIEDITVMKQAEAALQESEDRFRAIFEQAPFGIALTYMDTNETYGHNQAFLDLVGRTKEELERMSWLDYTHPNDIAEEFKLMEKLNSGEINGFQLDKRYIAKDGEIIWVNMIIENVKFSADNRPRYLCMIENINERKNLEKELSREKNLLETTLVSVGEGVITTDADGKIVFMNRIAEKLTGFAQSEANGEEVSQVFSIIQQGTRASVTIVDKALATGETIILEDIILVNKNQQEYIVEACAVPLMQNDDNINGVVLVFWDVSEQKNKEAKILYLSYHDQLTGLYNRRYYETELARLDQERNLPLTLIMGDVNGLKQLNDNFGHLAGDELLRKTAKILTAGCRADEIIARLGGDEFIILLPNAGGNEAEKIIERIKELANEETVCGKDISIAFGYATKNMPSDSMDEVFKEAENRMYQNKKEIKDNESKKEWQEIG